MSKNRTRNLEIKNNLTVTRGEGGKGKMGERRGNVWQRNMHKGPMVMDNGRD